MLGAGRPAAGIIALVPPPMLSDWRSTSRWGASSRSRQGTQRRVSRRRVGNEPSEVRGALESRLVISQARATKRASMVRGDLGADADRSAGNAGVGSRHPLAYRRGTSGAVGGRGNFVAGQAWRLGVIRLGRGSVPIRSQEFEEASPPVLVAFGSRVTDCRHGSPAPADSPAWKYTVSTCFVSGITSV